jgi:hypothetical protein
MHESLFKRKNYIHGVVWGNERNVIVGLARRLPRVFYGELFG